MTTMLWLILVFGYGLFTWTAGRRSFATAVLCFLNGYYLALLCFDILPLAMGTIYFYRTVAASVLGVLTSVWLEKKLRGNGIAAVFTFAIATGCFFLWEGTLSQREVLFFAFFGGMGLYHASAGIIPDKIEIGKALLAAAGFLLGTFLFVGI